MVFMKKRVLTARSSLLNQANTVDWVTYQQVKEFHQARKLKLFGIPFRILLLNYLN